MNTSHKKISGFALLSAFVLIAMPFAQANAQSGESLRVGAVLDITGGASFLGRPEQNGVKLAVDEVNKAGGLNGRKVELFIEDSKSTETDTVLAVRKLINQSKVSAIVGPSRTGGAMAAIPIVSEAEIALLAPVSGVAVVEPIAERSWIFRPGQGGDLSVGKVLDYAKRAGWKKMGVLYSADAYGEDGRNNLLKLAATKGVEVARVESFPATSTDLKPQLAKLKSSGVDAIFMHGLGAASVVVYKNARELDLGIPLISGHGQANSAFRDAVGDAVVGQPIVGAPVLVWSELPNAHPQKKAAEAFVQKYTAAYGSAPDMFAGVAYDGMNMVLAAMREVGGDKAKIRDWLETKVQKWVGVTGVFTFSAKDHAGLASDALVMMVATEKGWRLADYEK